MAPKTTTRGFVTTHSACSGFATRRAKPSGFLLARIFGVISPNVMMMTVMMSVAIHAPASPMRETAMTVATADDAMFTRLLPMRIVMSASS